MPRNPQGAETRTETRVEWRNVYANGEVGAWWPTRRQADGIALVETEKRIAVEERKFTVTETVTTITRHPIPPHAGEETKG